MKTLTITRPALLDEMFARHIAWNDGGLIDWRNASREHLLEGLKLKDKTGGGATALAIYAKCKQVLEGVVVSVDLRVSQELEVSSVTGSIKHLSLPAEMMEMRFQDPDLPAMLVGTVTDHIGDTGLVFIAQGVDGATHTLAITDEMWTAYCRNEYDCTMAQKISYDMPIEPCDVENMRYMAMLCVKVLAYGSCPRHAPALLSCRSEIKDAGIHPKHVSPGQKCYAVRYLPRVNRLHAEVETHESGATHRFLGRAGHIRYYAAERYVNVKGTWQWLPPIPPPEGVKITYKVRLAPAQSEPINAFVP